MKIRTDFVTNSSSSSFVTIHMKSQDVADFFTERIDEIEESNDGFCDVNVSVNGKDVSIETGDRDVCFVGAPENVDQAVSMMFEICSLGIRDKELKNSLADSIEAVDWSAEQWGLEGDDGRFSRGNYDPDLLDELLNEIAECNECEVQEITDEMFIDYVTPESDSITEKASFHFERATGESRYFYSNGMHKVIKEGGKEIYNSATAGKNFNLDSMNLGWIKDKVFVLTGFDFDIKNKYKEIIETAGGIVKSSTVLITDYLVFNSEYDHETTKLKRAKELIARGKNICIITGAKFEELLQNHTSALTESGTD